MIGKMKQVLFAFAVLSTTAAAAENVTVENFRRAETHFYMKARAAAGCFGKLCNERGPMPVDKQEVIRLNRDTPYTAGVFDLTSPVTITMPKTDGRFQSLIVINEDNYIKHVSYKPGSYVLSAKKIGSRYAYVIIRTFMDPNSSTDIDKTHRTQDEITVRQANVGKLDLPDWDQAQRQRLHDALLVLGSFLPDSRASFGDKKEVDPIKHLVATAVGWGGNRDQDAIYLNVTPKENSGRQASVLSVRDVPVDAFWSITVYNDKGFYEAPERAISINNVTAQREKDGSIVVHFGGDPGASNYLRIMPGWNYIVRLYRPRPEIINGKWKFPEAVAAH